MGWELVCNWQIWEVLLVAGGPSLGLELVPSLGLELAPSLGLELALSLGQPSVGRGQGHKLAFVGLPLQRLRLWHNWPWPGPELGHRWPWQGLVWLELVGRTAWQGRP